MINGNGNGVRGLNEWNTKIQNLYLRLYNIKSPVFVNVKSVPLNIVGGFYSVTSRGHDMICTVHSPSESLCVISFLSLVTAALAII